LGNGPDIVPKTVFLGTKRLIYSDWKRGKNKAPGPYSNYRNSEDLDDCGLRFEELYEETFRCPVCGTELKAVFL